MTLGESLAKGEGKEEVPNLTQTSDLLTRLQAFLPKIQEANQDLSGKENSRVDLDLQSHDDEDDDGDDDSGTDSDDDRGDGTPLISEASRKKKDVSADIPNQGGNPTIQIQFSLGDMEENPMMKLLANDGEESGKDGDDSSSDSEDGLEDQRDRKRLISNLLSGGKDTSSRKAKATKPLISEL